MLQKLSLQSNRLTSMEGLRGCQQLEELYLSHNGITCLQVCWVCCCSRCRTYPTMSAAPQHG